MRISWGGATPKFNNDDVDDVQLALDYAKDVLGYSGSTAGLAFIAKSSGGDPPADGNGFDFTVTGSSISFQYSGLTPVLYTVKQKNAFTIYEYVPGEENVFEPPYDGSKGGPGTDVSHLSVWAVVPERIVAVVPEPSTLLLGALAGGFALLRFRKRGRRLASGCTTA